MSFKAYLDLCRISNLPTVWTNVLSASLLATGVFLPWHFLALALAMSCFYMAGMSFNDICDFRYDQSSRPSRPLPSGRVSVPQAYILTGSLFLGGLLLLAVSPHSSGMAAGAVLVAAIVAYDLRHKENPYSVLIMALCRFLVFLTTSLALIGSVTAAVLFAASVQFAYVLISLVARRENRLPTPHSFPVIPALIAGISLLDGILLSIVISAIWLPAGIAGALLTLAGQRYVRGD
jgi:4-hydroxybenzoate polyprenyltransferase